MSLDAMESIQATFTLEDKEHLQSAASATLRLLRLKLKHNQENEPTVLNGSVKENKDNHSSVASLALVPVKVKALGSDLIVKMYAFLDNESNASFCSEELATQLSLSGCPTPLTLTTMEREESKCAASLAFK